MEDKQKNIELNQQRFVAKPIDKARQNLSPIDNSGSGLEQIGCRNVTRTGAKNSNFDAKRGRTSRRKLKKKNRKSKRRANSRNKIMNPERLHDLPEHLRGPAMNRYGGHQQSTLRGFRGLKPPPPGPVKVFTEAEKRAREQELREAGKLETQQTKCEMRSHTTELHIKIFRFLKFS